MKIKEITLHFFIALLILFFSAFNILSIFVAIFSIVLSIYFVIKRKYHYSLLYLIIVSAYYKEPNILNLPILGGYVFIGILFFSSLFILYKKDFFTNFTLDVNTPNTILFTYILLFFFLSLIFQIIFSNVLDSLHITYFKKDLLFIIVMILMYIFIINIEIKKIMYIFIIIMLSYLFGNLLLIILNINITPQPASPGYVNTTISYDEFRSFYPVFLVSIFLFVKNLKIKILSLIILLLLMFLFSKVGITGQMFYGLILLLIIYILSKRILRNFFIFLFILIIPFLSMDIKLSQILPENKNNDIFLFKLNSAVKLLEFTSEKDLNEVPWSPRVRIIELINILDKNPINILFGNGIGGYFTETNYKFNFNDSVNPSDDFDIKQIEQGRYYSPHGIGTIILKYGLIFYILMFFILIKIFKYCKNDLEKAFLISCYVTMFFGFGWTFRFSLLFIILLHFYFSHINLSLLVQINTFLFSRYIRRKNAN
ncbi:hypothetical protein N5U04_10570 [Aliarcobacter butzleri]|uniref:hypothetical protein n=1 Tax=Aliarcobacter butzleri TaxID=28197 RepID=UPI0021B2232D|nr:hypothetical protein [Aliarcobacter butzleri]MCT7551041.1 hypothetical protein [Aliarcobacter butzleri]MCT7560011.1 hypothetical protein [Aliarcobacter butzleri]